MSKLGIKKGDSVVIITGKDGQTNAKKASKVSAVLLDKQRVIVEGANLVQKHKKPRKMNDQGGIISQESPIHVSNVMLYCDSCKRGVRAAMKVKDNGIKVRVCKKCGAEFNK